MTEQDLLERIEQLVQREKDLRARVGAEGASEEDRQQLRRMKQSLDQCWDLLRQRRAKEEFGEDPDEAEPRPSGEVQSYQQ